MYFFIYVYLIRILCVYIYIYNFEEILNLCQYILFIIYVVFINNLLKRLINEMICYMIIFNKY